MGSVGLLRRLAVKWAVACILVLGFLSVRSSSVFGEIREGIMEVDLSYTVGRMTRDGRRSTTHCLWHDYESGG